MDHKSTFFSEEFLNFMCTSLLRMLLAEGFKYRCIYVISGQFFIEDRFLGALNVQLTSTVFTRHRDTSLILSSLVKGNDDQLVIFSVMSAPCPYGS